MGSPGLAVFGGRMQATVRWCGFGRSLGLLIVGETVGPSTADVGVIEWVIRSTPIHPRKVPGNAPRDSTRVKRRALARPMYWLPFKVLSRLQDLDNFGPRGKQLLECVCHYRELIQLRELAR